MSDKRNVKHTKNKSHSSALPWAKRHERPMEPHPKARSLLLELAMVSRSSLNEERTTTLFALGFLMMRMLPMLMMVFPMMVVVVVGRRLLQRQSKRSAEEIGDLQRLGFDAIMEPVASPFARAVMLDSTVSSCWSGSVGSLDPCDWSGLVIRGWVLQAEVFECGVVIVLCGGVGVGGGGDAACD